MQDEKIKKEEPSGIGFVKIIEQNNWYVVAFPPSPWCPLGIHDTGGYYFHLKFSLLPLKRHVRPVPAILALVRRSHPPRPFCRQVPGDISLNPFRSPPYRLAGRSAVIIPVIDRIQNDHPFRLWIILLSRPYRPFRTDPIPGPAGQIGRSKQKHEVIIWQYPDFCHIEAENPRLNT